MNDYSQPDFYRFNQDSLFLVHWILQKKIQASSILDLGAGCGIIGMELARALLPQELVLVELQAEYLPHLELNRSHFLPEKINCEVIISAFSTFQRQQKFDLIVCNPPYYLPGKGQASENPQRNLARSFIQDGWPVLLKVVRNQLNTAGRGYVVIKNQRDLLKEIQSCDSALTITPHTEGDLVVLEISHSE